MHLLKAIGNGFVAAAMFFATCAFVIAAAVGYLWAITALLGAWGLLTIPFLFIWWCAASQFARCDDA